MAKRRHSPRAIPSLAWLAARDRSGVFARSCIAAGVGAGVWIWALAFLDGWLEPAGGLPSAMVERLLLPAEAGRDGISPQRLLDRLPRNLRAPDGVREAIEQAAATVGADRGYLLAVAALESSLRPAARAQGSTALGLYQFTEDTWLRVVKVFGPRHGLAQQAQDIAVGDDGGVSVPVAASRAPLLRLRTDPRLSALLAAELARDNERRLARVLGRAVTPAEVYIAHFLGLPQAAHFITAAEAEPKAAGARLVPAAGEANPGFFRPAGEPASARAILVALEAYFAREAPRAAALAPASLAEF